MQSQKSFAELINNVQTKEPVTLDSIADATNLYTYNARDYETVQHSSRNKPVSNYQQNRNAEIIQLLKDEKYDFITPDENELIYVNSVFQNKNFHDISLITPESIDMIGKQELINLNNELKKFTKSMTNVNTAGIFGLLDELSKDIEDTNLEDIWSKAVNAKPTLLAMILGLFDKTAKGKSVGKRLQELSDLLKNKGITLESKLDELEKNLMSQKKDQDRAIKDLTACFEIYFKTFVQLRKQFILAVYLDHSYKSQLEQFKAANVGNNDLSLAKTISDYERNYQDIQNKRLLLHKSLIQLPVTADQSNRLIDTCKLLMKEIDNTLIHSFPQIRATVVNVGNAITAQKAFLTNESAKNLEENLAKMSGTITSNLAIQAEKLAADSRVREAQAVMAQVNELKEFKNKLQAAKVENQQKIDEATELLKNASSEVQNVLTNV